VLESKLTISKAAEIEVADEDANILFAADEFAFEPGATLNIVNKQGKPIHVSFCGDFVLGDTKLGSASAIRSAGILRMNSIIAPSGFEEKAPPGLDPTKNSTLTVGTGFYGCPVNETVKRRDAAILTQFRTVYSHLLNSQLNGEKVETVMALREARFLPSITESTSQVLVPLLQPIQQQISTAKGLAEAEYLRRTFQVPTLVGINVQVDTYAAGISLENRVIPTDSLAVPQIIGAKRYFAILTKADAEEDLSLHTRVSLTVDPHLQSELERQLRASGEQLSGAFTDWSLRPSKVPFGAKDIKVTQAGNELTITLVVSRESAGVILWQLVSDAGLFIELNWQSASRPSTTFGTHVVRLSLNRRSVTDLTVKGQVLANKDTDDKLIDYVRVDGISKRLPLGFVVPGRGTKALPAEVTAGTNNPNIQIPAEAVASRRDNVGDISSLVFIPSADDIVDEATFANQIPATVDGIADALVSVSIRPTFIFTTASGAEVSSPGAEMRLAPFGSDGARAKQLFIKPAIGATYRIRLKGFANFQGYSVPLKSKEFKTKTVYITGDLFN
jgi:hypothetical protein